MASSKTWVLLNSPSHIPFCWGFGRLEAHSALSWAVEIPPGAWRPPNFWVPLFAFCQASLVTLKESGSSSCQRSEDGAFLLMIPFEHDHFQTWFHLEGFKHKQPASRKYINASRRTNHRSDFISLVVSSGVGTVPSLPVALSSFLSFLSFLSSFLSWAMKYRCKAKGTYSIPIPGRADIVHQSELRLKTEDSPTKLPFGGETCEVEDMFISYLHGANAKVFTVIVILWLHIILVETPTTVNLCLPLLLGVGYIQLYE